ncbi:META domain-containing protein [Enterobacillus tribolii]|uniref:Heat shock protein HslJ n=1 Tax=Enterobacillus tribolii TaxID=1487935 RepID=A0A370R3S5_9GAMM|nr:META domain-containing protein [Enterobacillus tribolii]MBW7984323.1 META domain-containing protein [Enterobacillus tribolii]RDK97059.1 heat shock protein HslJ [Enterobacillus tribolii]
MNHKWIGLALGAFVLAGCARHADTPQQSDLLHRHFVLTQVDGKAFSGEAMSPDIEFGEKLHVSGAMCNRFSGWGELTGGKLKVSKLVSTRKACIDPQRAALDGIISDVLSSGANISLEKGVLQLSNGRHTLVYRQKDWL